MWYEVKVAYEHQDEAQGLKKVSELYLINAQYCTEAEEGIVKVVGGRVPAVLDIKSIKEVKYEEILRRDGDTITLRIGHNYQTGRSSSSVSDSDGDSRYYSARVGATVFNSDKGVEKKVKLKMLIEAEDFFDAQERLRQYIDEGGAYDLRSISLVETPIVDLIDLDQL